MLKGLPFLTDPTDEEDPTEGVAERWRRIGPGPPDEALLGLPLTLTAAVAEEAEGEEVSPNSGGYKLA